MRELTDPAFIPGERVIVGVDIEARVTLCLWDGEGWTYSVSYFANGEYHTVTLCKYEMHRPGASDE